VQKILRTLTSPRSVTGTTLFIYLFVYSFNYSCVCLSACLFLYLCLLVCLFIQVFIYSFIYLFTHFVLCEIYSSRNIKRAKEVFLIPFYLHSVLVHSANCV
jgi:hypothetical protein